MLDLGYTKIGVDKVGKVRFKNVGREAGKVRFTTDNHRLKIDPAIIHLVPGQE
jgi:hypothetical protein